MRLTYKNQRGKIYAYLEEGPVAQLGARFNRTEEAEGSNPSRSTAVVSRSFQKGSALPVEYGPIAQFGSASQWH
jgi:hypothetical protein